MQWSNASVFAWQWNIGFSFKINGFVILIDKKMNCKHLE